MIDTQKFHGHGRRVADVGHIDLGGIGNRGAVIRNRNRRAVREGEQRGVQPDGKDETDQEWLHWIYLLGLRMRLAGDETRKIFRKFHHLAVAN